MHGAVLLDAAGDGPPAGDPVERPADRAPSATRSGRRWARERLVAITGNDALTGFTAPKLVWVRDHEPETVAADRARAAAQGLRAAAAHRRVRGRQGGRGRHAPVRPRRARLVAGGAGGPRHRPGLDAADVRRARRSRATVTAEAAAATGLRAGTPVVAGGGDQAANAVGRRRRRARRRSPCRWARRAWSSPRRPRRSSSRTGRVHAFCHAVPGRWHLMSVMLSAAGSLRWFRDALAPGRRLSTTSWTRGGPGARPGARACCSCPTCSGERSPHPDPLARGAFVGLTARPRPAPPDAGGPGGRRVRAARRPRPDDGGRHARRRRRSAPPAAAPSSRLWRQILADVLDAEIVTVNTTEGAAYGAGLLAAVGAGWFPTVEAATDALVQAAPVAAPGTGRADLRGGARHSTGGCTRRCSRRSGGCERQPCRRASRRPGGAAARRREPRLSGGAGPGPSRSPRPASCPG